MLTNNCQLMSLLPLKEQALGLGIRQTGLVVSHQVFCDKLAMVSRVQCGIQKERIILRAEPDIRMDTIKHILTLSDFSSNRSVWLLWEWRVEVATGGSFRRLLQQHRRRK